MKTRDFVNYLLNQGCTMKRQCGNSHAMYVGPNGGVSPVPTNHRNMAPGTMRDACRWLGIPMPTKHQKVA